MMTVDLVLLGLVTIPLALLLVSYTGIAMLLMLAFWLRD